MVGGGTLWPALRADGLQRHTKEDFGNDAPLDVLIAGYADPDSAKHGYDALKNLQREGMIFIEGAILVSRSR